VVTDHPDAHSSSLSGGIYIPPPTLIRCAAVGTAVATHTAAHIFCAKHGLKEDRKTIAKEVRWDFATIRSLPAMIALS
jgi:hypothetical protein